MYTKETYIVHRYGVRFSVVRGEENGRIVIKAIPIKNFVPIGSPFCELGISIKDSARLSGVAVLNPKDAFDRDFGTELAIQRSMKKLYNYCDSKLRRQQKKLRGELNQHFPKWDNSKPVIRADV